MNRLPQHLDAALLVDVDAGVAEAGLLDEQERVTEDHDLCIGGTVVDLGVEVAQQAGEARDRVGFGGVDPVDASAGAGDGAGDDVLSGRQR